MISLAIAPIQFAFGQSLPLDLDAYQRPDGAITVQIGGDTVDPYFATKALLVAMDLDMNVQDIAVRWVNWAIQFQKPDGRFDRFCIRDQRYLACAEADADDAMLAVWIELLVRTASPSRMPALWQTSWQKADNYLVSLLQDHVRGIYIISRSLRVGLLMDNLEVYSAYSALRNYYENIGDPDRAATTQGLVDRLQQGIFDTFWLADQQRFLVSTQLSRPDGAFYPDLAAQLFPLLSGMPTPGRDDNAVYQAWMRNYKSTWLTHGATDFPWGLLAVVSYKLGDMDTVACWLQSAAPLRHGAHWNVLEEAAFQGLLAHSPLALQTAPSQACIQD